MLVSSLAAGCGGFSVDRNLDFPGALWAVGIAALQQNLPGAKPLRKQASPDRGRVAPERYRSDDRCEIPGRQQADDCDCQPD